MTRLPLDTPSIAWLIALALAAGAAVWLARRSGRPVWGLAAIGVASIAVYLLAFTAAYPLPAIFPATTNFGELERLSRGAFFAYVTALIGLFAGLIAAARLVRVCPPRPARRVLFGVAAVAGLVLIPLYPYTAIDVFYYVLISRVWTIHGVNPFLHAPGSFPADSYLHLIPINDVPSLYGPVWLIASAPAAWIAAVDFLSAIVFFKVLALIAHLATGWLIERIVRPAGEPAALAAAAFWLWNPLVLHEGIGEGHNDLVVTACLVAGIWLLGRRQPIAGGLAVAAASLIKVTALPLIPPIPRSDFWRPRGWPRRGAPAVIPLVVMLAWLAAYLPFWAGPNTLTFVGRLDFFAQSIPALAILWLREWRAPFDPEPVVKYLSIGLFGLIYVGLLIRPVAGARALAGRWFEVLFWYFVVAIAYYHNWYLIPILAFAAIDGRPWRLARAWTIALSGQIGLATSYFVWHWFGWGFLAAYTFTVPIYFGPALLVSAVALAYHVRNRRRRSTEVGDRPPEPAAPPGTAPR